MPAYLEDPSVLTKDKLKSELLAHNVELPSGNPTKDVFVQLYLEKLTALNQHHHYPGVTTAASLDSFSSDEELPPPPVVSNSSRSSGRKATRKSDKVPPTELDVTVLTDQGLKEELLRHGFDVGPIVASTRSLYERKLQKLLDIGATQLLVPEAVPAEISIHHNGTADPDLYSDKEEEVEAGPEPEQEPAADPEDPAPVVGRPLRSRGKTTPSSSRTNSSHHHTVEKVTASEEPAKAKEDDVHEETLPAYLNSPTGITASCRRPIKGAAERPIKSSEVIWNHQSFNFSPTVTRTTSSSSSYTESRLINRVSSLQHASSPPAAPRPSSTTSSSSSTSRPLSGGCATSLWKKLLLVAVVASFLFLVYQAMESNSASPFEEAATSE